MSDWKYRNNASATMEEQIIDNLVDQKHVHVVGESRKVAVKLCYRDRHQAPARAAGRAEPQETVIAPRHALHGVAEFVELLIDAADHGQQDAGLLWLRTRSPATFKGSLTALSSSRPPTRWTVIHARPPWLASRRGLRVVIKIKRRPRRNAA